MTAPASSTRPTSGPSDVTVRRALRMAGASIMLAGLSVVFLVFLTTYVVSTNSEREKCFEAYASKSVTSNAPRTLKNEEKDAALQAYLEASAPVILADDRSPGVREKAREAYDDYVEKAKELADVRDAKPVPVSTCPLDEE